MLIAQLSFVIVANAAPILFEPVEILDVPLSAVGGGWLDGDHNGLDDLAVATADPPSLQVFTGGSGAPPLDVPLSFVNGALAQVLVGEDPSGATFIVVEIDDAEIENQIIRATWTDAGFVVDWDGVRGTAPQVAGDVDGDGVTDVLVAGGQHLLRASSNGVIVLPAEVHGRELWSVQPVGDVDGNAHDDLVLSFWEYIGDGNYRPMRGHAGLYRGRADGLDAAPLWELDVDDVAVDAFIGASAVGLEKGRIVLSLTDLNESGCEGGEWIAVVHDAGTMAPVVHQTIEVPFDDDCRPNTVVVDRVPERSRAVVVWGLRGAAWFKWEDVPGDLSMLSDAEWRPTEWLLGTPLGGGLQLAALVYDATYPYGTPGVALWSELPDDPGTPPPPPDDDPVDPVDTGLPADSDQSVAASDDDGCGCRPGGLGSGAGLMWLAAAAALRSRRR